MERRSLGRAGPQISVVGYGAWEAGGTDWGPNPSDAEVIQAMRAAIDAGVTWIDTAEGYGRGRSEELVAEAVSGRRDDVLIFTKVAPDEAGSGLRPDEVRSAIRSSLRRLRTDHVDLYQIHWRDDRIPVEDTWGAMTELMTEGLVQHIGVSNFDRSLIERCLAIHHVDSVQNEFSLLSLDDRADLLPWLEGRGVGYLAYGPLAFGLLTGAVRPETSFSQGDWRRGARQEAEGLFAPGAFERNVTLADRLGSLADRLQTSSAALALRWAIEQKGVSGVIAGSRKTDHVRENAAAGEAALDAATLQAVEEIFAI